MTLSFLDVKNTTYLPETNEKETMLIHFVSTTVSRVSSFIRLKSSPKMTPKWSFFGKKQLAVLWLIRANLTHVLQYAPYPPPPLTQIAILVILGGTIC